jgi:hypothetical protein
LTPAASGQVFANVVDELVARVRIEEALYLHSRGIDRNDNVVRGGTCHADAIVDAGSGPQPVADLLAARAVEHQHTRHTVHSISNVIIEFISPQVAFVESHAFANEVQGAGYDYSWRGFAPGPAGARIVSWARYLDVFECRDRQWLIRERGVIYGDVTYELLESEPLVPDRFLHQEHGPGDPLTRYRERAVQVARELSNP